MYDHAPLRAEVISWVVAGPAAPGEVWQLALRVRFHRKHPLPGGTRRLGTVNAGVDGAPSSPPATA